MTVYAVLLAPPTARQIIAAGGSIVAAEKSEPDADTPFADVSKSYRVILTLSEVSSDDPDMLAAAQDMRDTLFSSLFVIAVDDSGTGTVSMRQMLLAPGKIDVTAFTNSEGIRSNSTLYGLHQQRRNAGLHCLRLSEGRGVRLHLV